MNNLLSCKPASSCSTSSNIKSQSNIKSSIPCATLSNLNTFGEKDSLSAVFDKDTYWTNGQIIKIGFVDINTPEWKKVWVEKIVMENLKPYVNLNFEFMNTFNNTSVKGDITITFKNDGAYSNIGKESVYANPSMNLGWVDPPRNITPEQSFDNLQYDNYYIGKDQSNNTYFDGYFTYKNKMYYIPIEIKTASNSVLPEHRNGGFGFDQGGTVLHEFCHAIGMLHEHQNPKNPIIWNTDKLCSVFSTPPNCWSGEDIIGNVSGDISSTTRTEGSEFDSKSVMLYPVLPGLSQNYPDGLPGNPKLSETDKKWLRIIYPFPTNTAPNENPTITTAPDENPTITTAPDEYTINKPINTSASANDLNTSFADAFKSNIIYYLIFLSIIILFGVLLFLIIF